VVERLEFATTARAIRHFAAVQPHADAVIDRGVRDDYAKFVLSLAQMTAELEGLGIARGTLVGVQSGNRFVHWLVVLACELLELPTVSLEGMHVAAGAPMLEVCGAVVSDWPAPAGCGLRWQRISLWWIAGVLRRRVGAEDWARLERVPPGDAVARVIATSGTTARPKLIGKSGALLRRIADVKVRDCPLARFARPRLLTPFNLAVHGTHMGAMGCILRGGTAIFSEGAGIYGDIQRFRPDVAWMIVGLLGEVLRGMPTGFRKPERLAVTVTGGVLGAGLRAEALARLASEVTETYSSSETSTIGAPREGEAFVVFDDVEVAIVGEDGQAMPAGEAGIVTVRSPTVADGYFDDAELTARHFRNGWFVTSDVGVMVGPRRLRLLGRRDDMLNLGGVKEAPGPIEAALAGIAGVRQAAVTAVANARGIGELCVALELEAGVGLAEVRAAVGAVISDFGTLRDCRVVDPLPLTAGGKVDRGAVGALFAAG